MKGIIIRCAKGTVKWSIIINLILICLIGFGYSGQSLWEICEVLFEASVLVLIVGIGTCITQLWLYYTFHPVMDGLVTGIFNHFGADIHYHSEPEVPKSKVTKESLIVALKSMPTSTATAIGAGVGIILAVLLKVIISNVII